jgi:hypothetical protein
MVLLFACSSLGCGGSTDAGPDAAAPDPAANVKPAAKPASLTPFQRRLNSLEYDERVKVLAKRFNKPESWVRKFTSANDSAADAEARLIRARVQRKTR